MGEDNNQSTYLYTPYGSFALILFLALVWYIPSYHPFRADYSFFRNNRTQNVQVRILYQTHKR